MSDNKKRLDTDLGKGFRFRQVILRDSESSGNVMSMGKSPLMMNFDTSQGISEPEDDYNLPGLFYREMLSDQDRMNLIGNIICSLKGMQNPQKEEIIQDQLHHYFKIDTKLGLAVADGMKIKVGTFLLSR